jgi:hypothetical protein
MLFAFPARRNSLFSTFVILWLIFFGLLSCTGVQSRVYRFIGNGDWKDANNWQDKHYPGHILSEGDSLIIDSGAICRIPPTVIMIKGVLIVKGALVNRADLTIAGQMFNRQGARVINGGSLQNNGLIVCEKGAGLTLEAHGKLINGKGDTIKNNSVMALVHGDLQNDGIFLNQEKGSIGMAGNSYTAGVFQNKGTLQIDSAFQIMGSFENMGRLWCTHRAVITVAAGGSLQNSHQTGKIRMQDETQLIIQSSGTLANEDSLWTDNKASILNQGVFTNYNYLYSEGKLTNQGQLVQSSALLDASKPGSDLHIAVNLFFGDTVLNEVSFDNSGGTLTNMGGGTFISFFQAKLKGYNSGTIYAITSQPSNANCGSPRCKVSFLVGATGTSIGYQWQVSADNGKTWNNVPAGNPYFGSTTSVLELTSPPDSFAGYQYRCMLRGPENGNQGISGAGTLTLNGRKK